MIILGIWDGHDSGAVVLADGRLVAAVNEERLTRRKLEVRFPAQSIAACLALAGVSASHVDAVAVSTTDPAKTLARCVPSTKERYYQVRRRKARPGIGAAISRRAKYTLTPWGPNRLCAWLSRRALAPDLDRAGLGGVPLSFFDHHECHAWCAAVWSGAPSAAVLTIDGVGDGLSATTSAWRDGRLTRLTASSAQHSLGVFFEHVTTLLNMRELEDEGKVMALAEYASPVPDADNPLLPLVFVEHGRVQCSRTGAALDHELRRLHWSYPNEQFAYMAQRTVERVSVDLAQDAMRRSGERTLAIAGGVASNIKATLRMRQLPDVAAVHVFPHMGDGGLALGAALACARAADEAIALDVSRLDLGPSYEFAELEAALAERGLHSRTVDSIEASVAELIANGAVVLWFQGGMEYGPRALGHRSVLARPDRPEIRDRLNRVLKRRVWYQPFCPSVLDSDASRIFDDWDGQSNRHMTTAYTVRAECCGLMSGVTGLDRSCRPQFVPDAADYPFARLLHRVRDRLGAGVVLNTSLNIHGEPLVCSPAQAVDVFLRSGADALALGPYLVNRDGHGLPCSPRE